ncbi:glycoside hydrolase family 88 protein [Echinicola strongylocentroti]|uniref:Glycoside hydrolase family 88 protein n=1 Tax=Echinicola strongylocentroti TaxID=1795355 RepID=A0A2Z4IDL1_9BACT|nr:glycoside hydrolase family 88 protein [Echinicola strongylocentroti]AWW28865.1 glycoside hydrolase family 88 protein [Echinicola strongylocentroti]
MISKLLTRLFVLIVLAGSVSTGNVVAQKAFDKEWIKRKMIAAMEWQEAHPIYAVAPTDWTNGAYYTGVARAHAATGDQFFMAALKNMGYQNSWDTFERREHADDIAISYSYLYVDKAEGRKGLVDLAPTKAFLDEHLFMDNKWKNAKNGDEVKNILWWWCDALFMAPPVINLYAKHTGDQKYLDAMHKYYKETYDKLYDQDEHLFARDARFIWKGSEKDINEPNGKKVFWSRGNGWVIGGLALILEDMPEDYDHRDFYEGLFVQMAERIVELQHKDGLWRTSLLSPASYDHGEVSGSGFFTYALTWGINNGYLEKDTYLPAVKKAWKALTKCQHDDGMVGWVQNIGASPEPASVDSWQNFGTGAFLLAGSEILKLQE